MLFADTKTHNSHLRYPDRYYGNVFIKKNLFKGIEIVAQIEQIPKKQAADFLIEAGLSKYTGKKISDYIEAERLARETTSRYRRLALILSSGSMPGKKD